MTSSDTRDERTRLLQIIKQAFLYSGDIESSPLTLEYNHIMERRVKEGKRFDPFKYFPPEIWALLLEYTIWDDPKYALCLCLVSMEWCHSITSMPHLWARIHLTSDTDLEVIEAMIFLSSESPLSVLIELPLVDPKTKRLLFQVKNSVMRLRVTNLDNGINIWKGLAECLQELQLLPNLEEIFTEASGLGTFPTLELDDIMKIAPRLQRIHQYSGPVLFESQKCLNVPSISRLHSLGLTLKRDSDILHILQQCQMLDTLQLDGFRKDSSEEEPIDLGTVPQIRLERLQLNLKGTFTSVNLSLINATSFTLVSLEVELEDNSMVLLVENQMYIPNLRFLKLDWKMEKDITIATRVSSPELPSLQELNFNFSSSLEKYEIVRPLIFFEWANKVVEKLPSTKIVSIKPNVLLASDLLSFLGDLSEVTYLSIQCPIEGLHKQVRRNFRTLKHLDVYDSAILPLLKAPNLVTLRLKNPEPKLFWPIDSVTPLSIGKKSHETYNFPRLESISSYTLTSPHSAVFLSFSHLTRIDLTSWQELTDPWGTPINRLLETLFFFPKSCPSLEYIST